MPPNSSQASQARYSGESSSSCRPSGLDTRLPVYIYSSTRSYRVCEDGAAVQYGPGNLACSAAIAIADSQLKWHEAILKQDHVRLGRQKHFRFDIHYLVRRVARLLGSDVRRSVNLRAHKRCGEECSQPVRCMKLIWFK